MNNVKDIRNLSMSRQQAGSSLSVINSQKGSSHGAHTLSNRRRVCFRTILLALLLFSTAGVKADDYVFMNVNGTTFNILQGSTMTPNTNTFNRSTCVWSGTSGSTFSNSSLYIYLGNNTLLSNDTRNLTIYRNTIYRTGNNNNTYYLRYNNGWQRNTASQDVVYTFSTQSEASLSTPTISGDETISEVSTKTYTATAIYSPALYKIAPNYGNGTVYYVVDGGTPSTSATVPTQTTGITYSWSASGNGASYVSVNASTGTITVNSLPTDGDKTLTLSCTPSYEGVTGSAATKTITLKADTRTVANPTGITANDVSINQGATLSYTAYNLTVADPTNTRPYDYVSASSDNTAVATVANSGGSFTITALTEGTATITITAYNQDNTTPAATATFIVTVTAPSSGVSGGVVTLNDYEDHTWTYYSGVDASVDGGNYNTNYAGKLYSPNPRNVKITYNGVNGITNSNTTVKVSVDESETTFVYYKTLEESSTSGEYSYQVISNPFSVRPSTGTGNNKVYYGFAGWKIISGGEYIKNHNNNDILSLDEEIIFNNLPYPSVNCTSAEIVFETTWKRANRTYVSTNPGNNQTYNTAGDYESNFYVINCNYTRTITTSGPVTIMMVEPDGSSDYRNNYAFTGNITPNNNGVTKIEWAKWTTTDNINATGSSFTIGRGILRPNGGGTLYGTNTNRNINQTFKVESGIYGAFYAIGGNGPTNNNMTKQHIVFGNDYDRASSNDNNLTITGTMRLLEQESAIGTDRLVITAKSGKFTTEIDHSTAQASTNCFYLWNNNSTNGATGVRTLIIEGGEFWHIAGGVDYSNSNDVVNLKIRMKGGTVHGSIYGGAARYDAHGGKQFVFTGGTVEGWIAGGSNGFLSQGTDNDNGSTQGNSYVYVGGTTQVNSSGNNTAINVSLGGNVYGAGCGNEDVNVSGRVTLGTNVVVADESYVERGVYGGGAYGGSPETANVYITGNAHVGGVADATFNVQGGVYGGARAKGGGNTNIYMTGGIIETGLYGGSNRTGTLTGSVTMQINGGQVGSTSQTANIHGGGYGAPTLVSGNVDVTLGVEGQTTPGVTVYGDVYGGSALGNVNTDTSNHTYVTLNKGVVYGDAYGGGLGDDEHAALVNGNVTVTENGVAFVKATTTDDNGNEVVTAGRIFGCNNLNGSPQGTVLVKVLKTARADGGPHTKSVYAANGNLQTYNYEVQAVYGGGNLAPYAPTNATANGQYAENGHSATQNPVQVVIDGCEEVSVEYVYGGGNAAPTPSTDLVVYGAYELGMVFGGGNGRDKYTRDGGNTWNENPGADVGINNGTGYGTGDANTTVYGGTIHELYGASNQKGRIVGNINLLVKEDETQSTCPMEIGKIVGAGKNADIDQDVNLVMGCMPTTKTDLVFAGADNANVNGHIELTITSGTFGKVFGGNNLGGIIKGYIKVNIEETGCNPIVIDELYLGGNQAAYSIYGYYVSGTLPDGRTRYLPRVSADDPNPAVDATQFPIPYAQPELNVISCTYIGKVFGGGLGTGAAMYADPTVNINMAPGEYADRLPLDENNSNKLGAVENVYGGGNEAAVHGNTKVNIGTTIGSNVTLNTGETAEVKGAYITGTVYGAGKGVEDDPEVAIVTGNTRVNMAGGHICRSIYGGGELGSVGTFTEKYTTQELHPFHPVDAFKTCKEGTGLAEVIISGGQVGLNNQLMPDPTELTSEDDYGYVFCGSKGESDSISYPKANLLAVVQETHLKITGGLIIASVYGGSENGEVLGNTHVEIQGGQIGTGHYKEGDVHHWDGAYEETAWNAAIEKVKAGTFKDEDAGTFHFCDAWPFGEEGNRNVYDHYADEPGYDAKGGSISGTDGHSFFGHVFGGGSGFYPFAAGKWRRTAGRVCGNTLTEITGGHILTNVYGGNEITDVLGKSKVTMTGGTVGVPLKRSDIQARPVNCNLFGAGMGDPRVLFNGWSNVQESEVVVGEKAVVFGSVFGGGEDGHVLGNSSTTIEGDAVIGTFGSSGVDGNVYGSGRGFSAIALTAGVICGNIVVNIKDNAKVHGSVYGGGRMAAVGTYLAAEDDATYYGAMQPGDSHGNVTVNITGGTIGNFNQLSNAANDIRVGDVFGGSKGTLMNDWAKSQMLGLVKNTTVNISEETGPTTIYGNVYGGGEIASVGSYKYATDSEVSSYNPGHQTEPISVGDVYELKDANAVTGVATINILSGKIGLTDPTYTKGHVFGGCLGRAGKGYSGYSYVDKSFVTLNGESAYVYGSVFGGGENGHVLHDTNVKIQQGTVGIQLDNQDEANIHDNMVYRGNVYGGGRGIDTYNDGGTQTYSITAGKVTGNTNVTITGGQVYRNVYGGGSLASVGDPDEENDGKATVIITGGQIGTDGGYHYGGNYTPDDATEPIAFNHLRENGHVFGSGRGVAGGSESDFIRLAYVKYTDVTIGGSAYVTGSVFGSGENGHVRKDTHVTVNAGTGTFHNEVTNVNESYPIIGYPLAANEMVENVEHPVVIYRGNVYGSGRGIDHTNTDKLSLTAGITLGDTYVDINGGTIHHNVYGGGSLASVGTTIRNDQGNVEGFEDETGDTHVNIKGTAVIGTKGTVTVDAKTHTRGGFNNGQVYGSGRGVAGDAQTQYIDMAFANDTYVTIGTENGTDNPEILGSVFGGGSNGHVKNDANVTIFTGTIGNTLADGEEPEEYEIYRGNVYGGGRGIDHLGVEEKPLSVTAGVVYGNTSVDIRGGHVLRNVYGGGSIATVGTVKTTPGAGETTDAYGNVVDQYGNVLFNLYTGTATISITGGQIGTDGGYHYGGNYTPEGATEPIAFNHLRENGHVFGSGRGVAGDQNSEYIDLSYTVNTNVTIGGTAYITGSVFGSGENGHVRQNTNVTINAGEGYSHEQTTADIESYPIIGYPLTQAEMIESPTEPVLIYRGNVYGGGRGIDHNTYDLLSETAGSVKGNTNVTINGGTIRHNVYGGGSLASTGNLTDDNGVITYHSETGKATVNVTGGLIGMSPRLDVCKNVDGTTNHSGFNNGQVYGGARGLAGGTGGGLESEYVSLAYVHDTEVNVSGESHIFGSVFGGGANGHVSRDTEVNISGGYIGTDPEVLPTTTDPTKHFYYMNPETGEDGHIVYTGNVYGGGRGIDRNDEGALSKTAGRVFGNTKVNVTGGVIYHNVYGGGSLASVGTFTEDGGTYTWTENTGKAEVIISGGSVGFEDFKMDDYLAFMGSHPGSPANMGDFTGYKFNNGRVFGSGRGMAGSTYATFAYVHEAFVTVEGEGVVKSNVFGSGENGHVKGDTHVNIKGGTVGYKVPSLYLGNVYGSGRGVDLYDGDVSVTAGRTDGNTYVVISGGKIYRDVYGGGSLASVGLADDENTGTANVTLEADAEVGDPFCVANGFGGNIFGSGRGMPKTPTSPDYSSMAFVKYTNVVIKGRALSNVYGGGNDGHVRRDTHVTLDGGEVGLYYTAEMDAANGTQFAGNSYGGNIYGAGKGVSRSEGENYSETAGIVLGNVLVDIKSGKVHNDVYGGAALAFSNSNAQDDPTSAKTIVNLMGGELVNAYGGGQGDNLTAATVYGDVTVNLNEHIETDNCVVKGNIFGCNNINGTPKGHALVHVFKTQGWEGHNVTAGKNDDTIEKTGTVYEVAAVYGGGNLAAYEPASNDDFAEVIIDGCRLTSIETVYGGGNAASAPATYVKVNACYEIGTVFGGGNGKDKLPDGSDNPGADVGYLGTASYGTGIAKVDVLGGTVHNVFGGSNTKGNVRTEAKAYIDENGGDGTCPMTLDEVYGGGNEAYMEGNVGLDLGCISSIGTLYGGANAADVDGDILLNVTSGRYRRVFGGNNKSGVIRGKIVVNIEETGCHPIVIGELYGCGNQAAYTTPDNKPDPVINIKSFTSIGNVFGGGLGVPAKVTGNTNVNVNEVLGLNNNAEVEAGTYSYDTDYYDGDGNFKGWTINFHEDPENPEAITSTVNVPKHDKGKIGAIGTIYGGGNAAAVEGNTNVKIGTEETVVFETPATATEADRTETVVGADVRGNVFGAGLGSTATVTGNTNVMIGRK